MKKWILVVDDNEMMREFLAHTLSKSYLITQAISYQDAMDQLNRSEIPDLVLTDYAMNGKTGLDLVDEIKSAKDIKHIPVIVLSSHADSKHRIDCLSSGADDYIVKPFNPIELKLRIDRLLNSQSVMA
ncbi:MAG: response regulator [Bacteroidota bacterium]